MDFVVIALGGNALSPPNKLGTFQEQYSRIAETTSDVVDLLEEDYLPILTHGNGPQVGSLLKILENHEESATSYPLDICVSKTVGSIGYMIQQCLSSELARRNLNYTTIPMVTRTIVEKNDPAFDDPSKPVGPYYSKEKAELLQSKRFWTMKKQGQNGYRRVVYSPAPREFPEIDAIRSAVQNEHLVIACGGGGIPVARKNGQYEGVEAVVDKDLASSLLARKLDVDRFVILSDIEGIYENFGSGDQTLHDSLTTERARSLLQQGEFPEGSMKPKVEAAVQFSEATGRETVIGSYRNLTKVVQKKSGTRILPSESRNNKSG